MHKTMQRRVPPPSYRTVHENTVPRATVLQTWNPAGTRVLQQQHHMQPPPARATWLRAQRVHVANGPPPALHIRPVTVTTPCNCSLQCLPLGFQEGPRLIREVLWMRMESTLEASPSSLDRHCKKQQSTTNCSGEGQQTPDCVAGKPPVLIANHKRQRHVSHPHAKRYRIRPSAPQGQRHLLRLPVVLQGLGLRSLT